MFDELKWRYEILLDMYRGKEVTMKKLPPEKSSK